MFKTLPGLQNSAEDCARLHEEARRWEQFITLDENRQTQAEVTQKFWQDCPAKILVSCGHFNKIGKRLEKWQIAQLLTFLRA